MNELNLTHAFVRKLTKGIRDAYGSDVAHSDILKVVAEAAGQKSGPMMHRLKTVAKSEESPHDVTVLAYKTTFSWPLIRTMLNAAKANDRDTVKLVQHALSARTAFVKYAFAIAAHHTFRPSRDEVSAEAILMSAFLQDDLWLRYATSPLTGLFPDEELRAFGSESYGSNFVAEMHVGGIVAPDMKMWTCLQAVRFGFVRFEGERAILVPYDLENPEDAVAKAAASMAVELEMIAAGILERS